MSPEGVESTRANQGGTYHDFCGFAILQFMCVCVCVLCVESVCVNARVCVRVQMCERDGGTVAYRACG